MYMHTSLKIAEEQEKGKTNKQIDDKHISNIQHNLQSFKYDIHCSAMLTVCRPINTACDKISF